MKIHFIVALISMMVIGSWSEVTEKEKLASIRKRYYAIQNNIDSYEKDERMICDDPDKHWTCSRYTVYSGETGEIVKVVEFAGEEGYWGETEYYFDKDMLFFVFSVDGNDRETPAERGESRYYVCDDTVIKALCRSGTEDNISSVQQGNCHKEYAGSPVSDAYDALNRYKSELKK